MITLYGNLSSIPQAVLDAADKIKHLNYKTTTPTKFRKNELTKDIAGSMMMEIGRMINVAPIRLDYVYFSVAKGAEPHVDALDPKKFTEQTFIVPIIAPPSTVMFAGKASVEVKVGQVYEFNHEKIHSMVVSDEDHGCVVVMIAVKKSMYS